MARLSPTGKSEMSGSGGRSWNLGLDWFDLVLILLTAGLSWAVLGPLIVGGQWISGGDGLFPVDQLQYLAWIRQAADHGLIGNRYDLVPDTRVFLHPGFLISGLAVRWFGLPLHYSNAFIWKPAAILIVFFGSRQYARRLLPAGWPARTATVLAIFSLAPMSVLLGWMGAGAKARYNLDFITSEMWPGQQLLGYELAACAIFSVPLILLGIERSRSNRSYGILAACSAAALLVSWLQPWQGAELLLIIVVVELWRWLRERERPWLPLGVVVLAGSLPAVYYAVLERTDPSWKLYGATNRTHSDPLWDWSFWLVVVCLLPLGLPALLSLRKRAVDWQETAVRVWSLAVLVVYLQPFGTFPFHSVQGLSVPLAVMAVKYFSDSKRGPLWLSRHSWLWVVPAVLVMTVPGTVHRLGLAKTNVENKVFPYVLTSGERAALGWLNENPAPGAVLADRYGGLLVPPYAGRESYVGPRVLTPDFERRSTSMNLLLLRFMNPNQAQAFVRSTGTRFVFEACGAWKGGAPDLGRLLGALVARRLDFGCARVYVLKADARSDRVSRSVGGPGGY